MSMLSAQIDELRAMAQLEKNLERPAIARILGDAADTIWKLRDDLQQANDALRDAEHDESVAWDRVRKLERENARLRELVDYMTPIAWYGASEQERDRMRELGVEVEP